MWSVNQLQMPLVMMQTPSNMEQVISGHQEHHNISLDSSFYREKEPTASNLNYPSIAVVPKNLRFSKLGEKRKFNITDRAQSSVERRNEFAFGWYTWNDEVRVVRSPIAVNVYKNHQMYSVCERTHNHSDDVNLGRPCQADQPQIRLVSSISSSYSHIPGSREHQSGENEGV
ncbi:hypothetical protein RND71_033639 [Anisodus tanguticus]|uniref:Subtilisin-like protease fibronectin type-III domain-containing protein n=1 Tax=Anisodus tanguticus TaxID=243964 RepID=A0AAE1R851_9SOLA|nr:hypothetical protein RND71_033639 [Anisodus tanguticus]